MSKAFRYLVSAIAILTLVLGSLAMAPAARSSASVHLKSGSFIPSKPVRGGESEILHCAICGTC